MIFITKRVSHAKQSTVLLALQNNAETQFPFSFQVLGSNQ